jgi:excisionase family DNA binding protein
LKEFLNIDQLSDYLNLRKSTLYKMAENKDIPFFRFGRIIRFKKQEIDAWIEDHKEEVIDPNKKAKEILKKVRSPKMDVDSIVSKAVEEVKKNDYTPGHGKSDRIRGLRKEVEDVTI